MTDCVGDQRRRNRPANESHRNRARFEDQREACVLDRETSSSGCWRWKFLSRMTCAICVQGSTTQPEQSSSESSFPRTSVRRDYRTLSGSRQWIVAAANDKIGIETDHVGP